MGISIQARENPASESRREELRLPETSFGSVISDVARLLWPKNTAPNVAAIAGCSVRMAEMYLSGSSAWSGDALAAIVAEILRRHAMRNVRVIAKN